MRRKLFNLAILLPAVAIISGCARVQIAEGTFIGETAVATLHRSDGTSVEAVTLRIATGPPMSSPHITPAQPTIGWNVVLVDARGRIFDPTQLPEGQTIEVVGKLPPYFNVKDRSGNLLTLSEDTGMFGMIKTPYSPSILRRQK